MTLKEKSIILVIVIVQGGVNMSRTQNVRTNWVEILQYIRQEKPYLEIVNIFKRKNIEISVDAITKVRKEFEDLYAKEAEKEKKLEDYYKKNNEELIKQIQKLEEKMLIFEDKTDKKIQELLIELGPSEKLTKKEIDLDKISLDDYNSFKNAYRDLNPKDNSTFRLPSVCRDILNHYCGVGKTKGLLNLSKNEFITGLILEFDKNYKEDHEE